MHPQNPKYHGFRVILTNSKTKIVYTDLLKFYIILSIPYVLEPLQSSTIILKK